MRHHGIEKTREGYRIRAVVRTSSGTYELDRHRRGIPLKEALRLRSEWIDQIRGGEVPGELRRARGCTLGEFAKSWAESRLPLIRSALTRRRYAEALDHHILPFLGPRLLSDVRPSAVEAFLAHCSAQRYARNNRIGLIYGPATINGWLRVLRTVLRAALRDDLISRDPTISVRPLEETAARQANCLTEEQLPRFLREIRKIREQWYVFCLVCFGLGARPGEIRPLRWDVDVILEPDHHGGPRIILQQSQHGKYLGPTKTRRPRVLPLPGRLVTVLKAYRAGQAANPMGLLFTSTRGGYISPSALDKPFAKACATLGLPKLTQKGMRRTFINVVRRAGIDRDVRKALVGQTTDLAHELYQTFEAEEKMSAVSNVVDLFPR